MSNAPRTVAMSEQTMMEKKFSTVILSHHPAKENVVKQGGMFYSTGGSFLELLGKLRGIVGRCQAVNPSGSY